MLIRMLCLAVLLPLLLACVARSPSPQVLEAQGVVVYVVDHGKHAGLALRSADLPEGLVPERADYPGARYLEIGWGDWDYYQIEDPGLWITLKAALFPTASVLHVVGVHGAVEEFFHADTVIRLTLSRQAYRRLVGYIHASFDRQSGVRARRLRQGYYANSGFYPATGRFHIFYTCNGWVAEALETAGIPVGWPRPVTADQLMARLRRLSFEAIRLPGSRVMEKTPFQSPAQPVLGFRLHAPDRSDTNIPGPYGS